MPSYYDGKPLELMDRAEFQRMKMVYSRYVFRVVIWPAIPIYMWLKINYFNKIYIQFSRVKRISYNLRINKHITWKNNIPDSELEEELNDISGLKI